MRGQQQAAPHLQVIIIIIIINVIIVICSVTPDSGPSQLSIILSVSTVMAQTSNARLWNVRIYQVKKESSFQSTTSLCNASDIQILPLPRLPHAAESIKAGELELALYFL